MMRSPKFLLPAAALSALLAAVVCGLPHLIGWARFGAEYTPFSVGPGVSSLEFDETHAYLAGPRRFLRDGLLSSESDVYELRSAQGAQPLLPSLVIGWLGRLTGSLEAAWAACDLLFPALLFLLLYRIAGLASSSAAVRLAAAWFCLLVPFGPRNFLMAGAYGAAQPLEITRTPQPELSFPLLLLGCYAAAAALEKGGWMRLALAGLVLGLNAYAYYFYALAAAGAIAVLAAALAFFDRLLFRRALVIGAWALAAALPFAWAAFEGEREGGQSHLLARMGALTHAPSVAGLILLVVAAGCLAAVLVRLPRARFGVFLALLAALLAAAGLGLNTQVLTGYNPQNEHFWNRLVQPVAALLLCLLGAWVLEKRPRSAGAWRWAAVLCASVLIAFGAVRQTRVALRTAPDHIRTSPAMELLQWARAHLSPEAVVGSTNHEFILLIPPVAGTWSFVPCGLRSMASDGEILERYLIVSLLAGKKWPEVEHDLAETGTGTVEGWRNATLYVLIGRRDFSVTLRHRLHTRWEQLDAAAALHRRKLDYLIEPAQNAGGAAVYQNRAWKLVRLQPEQGGGLTVARSARRP